MQRPTLAVLATLLLLPGRSFSQGTYRQFELGSHFTMLRTNGESDSCAGCSTPQFALGPAFTINLHRDFALDGALGLFPKEPIGAADIYGGHLTQGLFGLKAGIKGARYGFFAKVRPGFVSWSRAMTDVRFNGPAQPPTVTFGRRTFFAVDFGGGFELYPGDRTALRFDLGVTRIRFSVRRFNFVESTNNLQTSATVFYRLGKQKPLVPAGANDVPPHKFFDGMNLALMSVSLLAQTADMVTTRHMEHRYPGSEGNPIARPFVSRGWAGTIAIGGIADAAMLIVQYGIHRLKNHRIERLVPVSFAIGSGISAYENAQKY